MTTTTLPSRRACITAARFALPLHPERDDRTAARNWRSHVGLAALAIDAALPPAGACLITGPSGAGKTTLLERLARATPSPIINLDAPRFRNRARSATRLIDLFPLPLDTTLRLLAAAGLAEAPLFLQPARNLSEGQRFRLTLALAMAEALRLRARAMTGATVCPAGQTVPVLPSLPITLIADEFCATLDPPTAQSVCAGLRHWLRISHARLIAATPRTDLAPFLRATLIARTTLHHPPQVTHADHPS